MEEEEEVRLARSAAKLVIMSDTESFCIRVYDSIVCYSVYKCNLCVYAYDVFSDRL